MTSVNQLAGLRESGTPIVMVTAYDYPSAQVAEAAGVDAVLVGDSAATTVLGHDDTVAVDMPEMLMLAAAVRRGLRTPLLVGDLPFGSYERSDSQAIRNAQRFVKRAGCDAVKLEGGGASAERARAIVRSGIPVMGHVGLTPQTAARHGGMTARGRTASAAEGIRSDVRALEEAGCFALVFEAVPSRVTELLMPELAVPVIGIGAGPVTDGQALVYHDLLGLLPDRDARFVKTYADLRAQAIEGLSTFAAEVRSGVYPGTEHEYRIPRAELDEFRRHVAPGPPPSATPE